VYTGKGLIRAARDFRNQASIAVQRFRFGNHIRPISDIRTDLVLLTLYGGVGRIGRNKVILQDRGTKVLLDFGLDFSLNSAYYSWPSFRPRASRGLHDYFVLGLLPKVKGLYRRDLLRRADLQAEDPEFSFVAISHGHLDHVGCLPFVHESIPVGMGRVTKEMLAAISANRHDLESEFIEVELVPDGRQNSSPCKNRMSFI